MVPAQIVHGQAQTVHGPAQIVHGPAQTVHGQGGVVSVFGDSLNPETPTTLIFNNGYTKKHLSGGPKKQL